MPEALILAEELIPPIEVDPVLVTPGVVGFFATFLMAAGAVFLIFDMVRRVRRVRYRAEISERWIVKWKSELKRRIQRNKQHCRPVAEKRSHRQSVEDFVKSETSRSWVWPLRAVDHGAK